MCVYAPECVRTRIYRNVKYTIVLPCFNQRDSNLIAAFIINMGISDGGRNDPNVLRPKIQNSVCNVEI